MGLEALHFALESTAGASRIDLRAPFHHRFASRPMAHRQWGAFGFATRRGCADRQPGVDAPLKGV